jgi:hypothetical protein
VRQKQWGVRLLVAQGRLSAAIVGMETVKTEYAGPRTAILRAHTNPDPQLVLRRSTEDKSFLNTQEEDRAD